MLLARVHVGAGRVGDAVEPGHGDEEQPRIEQDLSRSDGHVEGRAEAFKAYAELCLFKDVQTSMDVKAQNIT